MHELIQLGYSQMDRWLAYISATVAQVPDALNKIAFDKFHVANYLGEALDKVRRTEHRHLQAVRLRHYEE